MYAQLQPLGWNFTTGEYKSEAHMMSVPQLQQHSNNSTSAPATSADQKKHRS